MFGDGIQHGALAAVLQDGIAQGERKELIWANAGIVAFYVIMDIIQVASRSVPEAGIETELALLAQFLVTAGLVIDAPSAVEMF